MKVLLVHGNREHSPQPAPPLGLCLLASSLESHGFEPRLLDLCFSRDPFRDLERALGDFAPHAVGLSLRNLDNGDYLSTRSYLDEAAALARAVRAHSHAPLIIGGPAVSIAPRRLLDFLEADYAVIGEGEQALPLLLGALDAGASAAGLPGVCAASDPPDDLPAPARVADLEASPLARMGRWLDLRPYLRGGGALPIQTKRGCPLRCTYCTYRNIEGAGCRPRSPEAVAAEVVEVNREWRARRFEIVDSVFNHPLDHALSLCEALVRANLRAEFQTTSLNPAGVTRELLALMQRARFTSIICSPDSASEKMLANLCKGFGVDDIARTIALAHEVDLPLLWALLFGGPGEDEGTVRQTITFMEKNLGPRDRVICTLGLRVYPDTDLARTAAEEGLLPADPHPLAPAFYFSPRLSLDRLLTLLDGSSLRRRLIYLTTTQRPSASLGLRLHTALHLPGPAWRYLPLYNTLSRLSRPRRPTP